MRTMTAPLLPYPAEEIHAQETLAPSTADFDAGVGVLPSWGELVAQHADSVYRLAYRLTGNRHDAEDLTQDCFMRVFRSLKDYKPGTFEGWLHRITTNLFLDMVRRRSLIRMEALPEDYDRVESHRAGEVQPEEAFAMNNLDPALEQALDTLTPEFRVAVVLCDGLGMSYDEIARTLGVKMGTVRSRIHRARTQLRAQLEQSSEGGLTFIGADGADPTA
ncbi:RNA polymerase sigma factor SigE [Corynebacterium sp. 320]|uniref:RNA polymerase sigma factor SigE n=1 Tax=Corynebacterium TaxID=1716 RepID=UPI00125CB26E|nr:MULTISPECIES: RNA polymerase sigma factor SigE [Corynebacterium]KAB1503972.1 RNA polymerase sigma factor SigE [Corynebacterium sp. 320]KAB1552929.1 RNA polymerase sigma factor SigE [Corynebacterium sp. 321]KAB1553851.1 RNA polymerase sigma factor SigE [Corynebacterium sp. 319]KAB3528108.1 RNA polymerase sigma factor SigE [Corynebacterium sp. 250]KAB3540404.1 RNA polymerase sigma factor SigE [Corynebacterium sp. 366]